jgi:hypothetical protein
VSIEPIGGFTTAAEKQSAGTILGHPFDVGIIASQSVHLELIRQTRAASDNAPTVLSAIHQSAHTVWPFNVCRTGWGKWSYSMLCLPPSGRKRDSAPP